MTEDDFTRYVRGKFRIGEGFGLERLKFLGVTVNDELVKILAKLCEKRQAPIKKVRTGLDPRGASWIRLR